MRLPLIGELSESIVSTEDAELTNWYLYPTKTGRSPLAIYGTPGTITVGSLVANARGSITLSGIPYVVTGSSLYSWDSSYSITNHGTISGSDRVDMAADIDVIIIVTGAAGDGYTFTPSTNSLTTITDPDFPGADTVDILDGYGMFSQSTGVWFISGFKAYSSFNATETGVHESSPDVIQTIKSNLGEAYVIGKTSTEVFYNSKNVDFPLDRNDTAIINRGTIARFSVVQEENTLFFLGDDRIVYRMRGYNPEAVSDQTINSIINAISIEQCEKAWAYIYIDHGVKFYVLTVPGVVTLVLDTSTGFWHKRKHYDLNTHQGGVYVSAYNKHFLVDDLTGGLLEMSRDYYNDSGAPLVALSKSSYAHNEDYRMKWRFIKFILESGTGISGDTESSPKLMVRWSDDGGRIYKNKSFLDYGKAGEYQKTVVRRNCGSSRSRIIEFSIASNAKRNLIDCYAEIS